MNKYKTGLEVLLEERLDLVQDKRVGLVTNHTGLTTDLKSNVDLLYQNPDIDLKRLYGPEHGVRGSVGAGDKVEDGLDPKTGLPVYSLYGDNKKPGSDVLKGIDLLIFDIQDLGVRFYTYVSTLFYCLESCSENNIQFIVLDRFNPLGRRIEGNILQEGFSSFVGLYPLPHRHGMTFGELSLWANEEFELKADLKVIKLKGWEGEYFDQLDSFWIPPSPGIPHFSTALVYPITCMLEGTNISEGRGTANPFQYLGAPWIDPYQLSHNLESRGLPGVRFRPVFFSPSFSKHKGKECGGVHLLLEDRNKVDSYLTTLTLLRVLYSKYPDEFEWRSFGSNNNKYFIDLLMGTDEVRKKLDQGLDPVEILSSWDIEEFKRKRENYILY